MPKPENKTAHTIYLTKESLAKVDSLRKRLKKETQVSVSLNAAINKIIEDYR